MDNEITKIAIEINKISQQAYAAYLPVVEELCGRKVSEEELSHCLDYLLDFAGDERILKLYKKLCRTFICTYPRCIEFYVKTYKEMYENAEF